MLCWADFTIATRGYSFRKGQRYCDASNPSQNKYLEEGGIRFLMADEITARPCRAQSLFRYRSCCLLVMLDALASILFLIYSPTATQTLSTSDKS
jgi:hypothetical protein